MKMKNLLKRYRVEDGRGFRLKQVKPSDTHGFAKGARAKDRAASMLSEGVARLAKLQDRLYAQDRWALLLVFQAMDAAGKDGTIKHVMSGINPQGCQVYSFKVPSPEELDHDYLWRTTVRLPQRGRIGIFNRSYYEEVLVVRVHKELLAAQKLPDALLTKHVWKERFEDIRCMERHLTRNGTVIRKFFLHVSKEEQRRRFLDRLQQPSKNWKFSIGDASERQHWDKYMDAYEDAIRHTATQDAPWFIVPADNKWFARLVVGAVIVEALEELKLEYPAVDARKREELRQAERELLREDAGS